MNNYSMISFEKKIHFSERVSHVYFRCKCLHSKDGQSAASKAIPRPITDEPLFVLMNI